MYKFGWKYPAAEFAQTPVPKALVPVAQAATVVEVQTLPAGQGVHSALPLVSEYIVGAVQVVAAVSGAGQAVPAAHVVHESLSADGTLPWGHMTGS